MKTLYTNFAIAASLEVYIDTIDAVPIAEIAINHGVGMCE
jgi:hypothetical protein